jgi:heat shock protein beta
VLLFNEPIDEFMLQRITKYKEFDFVNISKEHTVPWEKEDDKTENEESTTKEFLEWFKTTLDDAGVDKVKISKTLTLDTDTPCVVLSSKYGWTGNMEKLMKAQPLNDNSNMAFMKGRKIVELNVNHPVINKLIEGWKSEDENEVKTNKNTAQVVYQTSLISAGFPIENPIEYSRLVQTLLVG